jgi:cell filamentation protein
VTADPYVYPGTDVLINKENIRDRGQLRLFEAAVTANRMEHVPTDLPISYEGFRRLHRYIFQPVYVWAGKPRRINIAKGGTMFCLAPYIDQQMERRFSIIQSEKWVRGMTRESLIQRSSEHICEINAIHPFREGNGRTLRAFLQCLAGRSGHRLELERIDPAAWIDASVQSFRDADYQAMTRIISGAVIDRST